jgi:hypothetical protein
MPNGSTLTSILEKIDDSFAATSPVFSPYETTCLNYPGFVINDIPDFLEAVDNQVCTINDNLNILNDSIITKIANLTATVDAINHPNFTDNCGIGILTSDTIKQVLIKLKNAYCAVAANVYTDNSPTFLPINTPTISWVLSGLKNHTPAASVIKSGQPNNALQILSDGLYVTANSSGTVQIISYNSGTRVVSLSNGGGSFTLPADADAQTLSLNTGTKVLSISGGNSVNLTPVIPTFTQTAISPTNTNSIQISATGTANTNISANAKISSDVGNIISIHSDGLFAPTPTPSPDEEVKASSAGTPGTLIEKVEGCTNGATTTSVTYNNITDKITVCAAVSSSGLLAEIAATPALLTALCVMVKSCLCYKFRVLNTTGSPVTYSYTGCDNTVHSGLSLGANAYVDVCGISVTPNDATTYVFNLGYC